MKQPYFGPLRGLPARAAAFFTHQLARAGAAGLLLALLPLAASAQTAAATFTLQANLPSTGANSNPYSVAIADVNGDGKPDALTANYTSSTLGVLLGNGLGGFTLQANSPSTGANSNPVSVAIADVNGDGKLDALTANYTTSRLGVLLGNGLGGFTLQANLPSTGVASNPVSVAIADVNGDGKPDALTANLNTNRLGVLLGNGLGGFTLQTNSPSTGTGSNPNSVAIADVNGDGKLDALTANYTTNTLGVLLGNGLGSFTLQANSPSTGANSNPYSVAIADVNGDGKLDALTANYTSSTLGVLLNTTAPTLTSLSPSSGPVGTRVTLTGVYLSGAPGVSFNGTAATTFSVVNSTTLTAIVPAGASSGPVTVTTPGSTSNGLAFTVISAPVAASQAVTVQLAANGTATLNAASVDNGSTGGGNTYTIQKISYGQVPEGSTLTLTAPAGFTFTSSAPFASFGTPSGSNGNYTVGGCNAASSASVVNGLLGGQNTGSIAATNGAFGGDPCPGTLKALAVVAAYSADAAAQTYTCAEVGSTNYVLLTATNSIGSSTTTAQVTVLAPPSATLSSLSPNPAPAGGTVTLSGTNLGGVTTLTVNGTAATITGNSGSAITFVVPAGATSGNVVVTAPCGTSSGLPLTVAPAPTLTSLSPTSGVVGTSVTLTGTDLTGATAVSFNGTAATTLSVVNATTVTATVPAGASTGNVTVTTAGGTSNGLAFTVLPAPTLTAASPNPGGLGQVITLTGTNLGSPTALTINGANALANIVGNTGTSLVVRVPVSAAAAGTVSISTANGTATLPFSLMAAPGNALAFDGVADRDYVRPAGTLPATGEFTLEAWVNPSAFTYPLNAVVLADNFPTGAMHCQFNGDKLGFSIAGNSPTDQVSAVSVPLNRWTHVAVVYSASAQTVSFYYNGVLVDARSYSSALAIGAQPYSVGTWLNGGTPQRTFTGRLDELRLYSAALTQAQVQADMLSTASAVPASLSCYLNFDQGTPAGNNAAYTTLYDLAGGTAATLTGFDLSSGNTASNYVASYALVVPTATAATSRTATSFIATWAAPANGTVTGYLLDVSTVANFSQPVAGSPFAAPASATSYGVTGLQQNTTYYYRVRALNSSLAQADQGAASNTVSVATPLPVVLTQFAAAAEGPAAVHLTWATASEKNSRAFEVERSTDGVGFATIGTVAAAGTTATAHSYALRDAALPAGAAVLYYRLRQVDLDGSFSYSPVRSVAVASGLSLYPNPALGGAATLTGVAPGAAVQVLDALGRQVATATANATGTATLAAGLAPGVYVVRAGSAALRLTVE